MKITVAIPLPPSLNNAYATDRRTGRRFASAALTAFKAEAIPLIRIAAADCRMAIPPGAALALTLRLYFGTKQGYSSSDADNRIKAAMDAAAVALGFNDNRIIDVRCVKAGVDRAAPRCELELVVLD